MNRYKQTAVFLTIFVIATLFRFSDLNWDGGNHYHPDERYISWVASSIYWPEQIGDLFDLEKSTINPFYWPAVPYETGVVTPSGEARQFTYGHFPLYLGVVASRFGGWMGQFFPDATGFLGMLLNVPEWEPYWYVTIVGRALTALFELGTVVLIFFLGRRLYNETVGLLAMGLVAVAVLPIQLSHFYTFDQFMSFFVLASLYCFVRAVQERKEGWGLVGAVMVGLAVGSKFSAVLLIFPIIVFVFLLKSEWKARLWLGGKLIFLAIFFFGITNPFVFLDQRCDLISGAVSWGMIQIPALNWGNCFLSYVGEQGAMVRGDWDVGYVRQYIGTVPYLYFLEMLWRWGLAPLLGTAVILGTIWRYLSFGVRKVQFDSVKWGEEFLVASWFLPYFLSTGNFSVKFLRYMEPVLAIGILYAAAFLWFAFQEWPRFRMVLIGLVVGGTSFYAFGFYQMYQVEHPWLAASRWVYEHVPRGSLIVGEQWDDTIPTNLFLEDERLTRGQFRYRSEQLTWLTYPDEKDTVERLESNLAYIVQADYLVIASNRVYGVVPRLEERYPISGQYHQLLFSGQLGYELIYVAQRGIHWGEYQLRPDYFSWAGLTEPKSELFPKDGINWGRVDESFTVYDQPLVMIFINRDHKSMVELKELFQDK